MNYKSLMVAAVLAATPLTASATIVFIDNDPLGLTPTTITNGNSYNFDVVYGDGEFNHTFTSGVDGTGTATVSLIGSVFIGFSDLVASWLSTDGLTVYNTVDVTSAGIHELTTEFAAPDDLTQILNLTWDNSDKSVPAQLKFDGDVTISAVPVPAGLLLMGTALAGLGLTRRKA